MAYIASHLFAPRYTFISSRYNTNAMAHVTSCARGRRNMPHPLQVDLWPFDLESGVRVTRDVAYLCANFYRVTLCESAVFAVARCLSVPFVHSIQTAEDIVILLCRPGSPIILVFWLTAPISNSKGNPFGGGVKYKKEWENFAIFDWNRRLSRKQ